MSPATACVQRIHQITEATLRESYVQVTDDEEEEDSGPKAKITRNEQTAKVELTQTERESTLFVCFIFISLYCA